MSRLDYFLIPQSHLTCVVDCQITLGYLSDHSYIELTLEWEASIRGRGFWKLNTSLLTDPEYVSEINKTIDFAQFRYEELSPALKWEMLKTDIIEISMQHSHIKASKRKKLRVDLLKKKASLRKKLACINLHSDKAIAIIQKVNVKLDEIDAQLQKEADYDIWNYPEI